MLKRMVKAWSIGLAQAPKPPLCLPRAVPHVPGVPVVEQGGPQPPAAAGQGCGPVLGSRLGPAATPDLPGTQETGCFFHQCSAWDAGGTRSDELTPGLLTRSAPALAQQVSGFTGFYAGYAGSGCRSPQNSQRGAGL